MSRPIDVAKVTEIANGPRPATSDWSAYMSYRRARIRLGLPTHDEPVTTEAQRSAMRGYMAKRRARLAAIETDSAMKSLDIFKRCPSCDGCCQGSQGEFPVIPAPTDTVIVEGLIQGRCNWSCSTGCRWKGRERPLECRAYPLLVTKKNNSLWLCVDEDCPAGKEIAERFTTDRNIVKFVLCVMREFRLAFRRDSTFADRTSAYWMTLPCTPLVRFE